MDIDAIAGGFEFGFCSLADLFCSSFVPSFVRTRTTSEC